MVRITDKKDCSGCHACVSVCARHSITMQEDNEGFLYPKVDTNTCTDCGLCEKVCPVLNQSESHEPLTVFAAFNSNEEIRMKSSSGGIFTLLAETILDKGGVVFGARFDKDWEVVHDYTEIKEGLAAFRGSKYVQSRIGDTFKQAEQFLKQGRLVLYSGTPCQIAGLKKFLRKEYDNLLVIECVCHSVPSPGIWRQYLSSFTSKRKCEVANICNLNFRDKITGWEGYSVSMDFTDGTRYVSNREQDLWMKGFIGGLYTRPSCSHCPVKAKKSYADITIGDLWGNRMLLPEVEDNKGICVIIVHTDIGNTILDGLNVQVMKTFTLEEVASKNPAICYPFGRNKDSTDFYFRIQKGVDVIKVIEDMTKSPYIVKLPQLISRIVRFFIGRKS